MAVAHAYFYNYQLMAITISFSPFHFSNYNIITTCMSIAMKQSQYALQLSFPMLYSWSVISESQKSELDTQWAGLPAHLHLLNFVPVSFFIPGIIIVRNENELRFQNHPVTDFIIYTGIHWGMLSDRIGRRPVILTGLTGTMMSIFLFGLSKSFAWAIISRALCGLLVRFAIFCATDATPHRD